MVRETRYLLVGNLPEKATEDEIIEYFQRYGKIQSVKVHEKKENETCNVATVAFMDIKSASKAHGSQNVISNNNLRTDYSEGSATGSVVTRVHDAAQSTIRTAFSAPGAPVRPPNASYPNRAKGTSTPSKTVQPRTYHDSNFRSFERSSDKDGFDRSKASSPTLSSSHSRKSRKKSRSRSRSASQSRSRSRSSSSSSRSSGSSSSSGSMSRSRSSRSRSHSNTRKASSPSRGFVQGGDETGDSSGDKMSQSSQDKRPLGILIRGLPLRSTDTSIRDGLFHEYKKFGKVFTVVVKGQSEDRFAIVSFRKSDDAAKALESSQDKLFFGTRIKVSPHEGIADVEDTDFRPPEAEWDEYHPKSTRTLFVGNLEKEITIPELKEMFKKYGEVIDVDVKRQGAVSDYAFIQFSDITSVVKSLRDLDGENIGPNKVKLGFGKSMPTSCVWLDNLAESVTERLLRSLFSRFGNISHIVIDKQKGRALIYYANMEQAQMACTEMRCRKIHSSKIHIDFASRDCQNSFFDKMERSGQIRPGERPEERRGKGYGYEHYSEPYREDRAYGQFGRKHSSFKKQNSKGSSFRSRSSRSSFDGFDEFGNKRTRNFDEYSQGSNTKYPDDDSFEQELLEYGHSQRERRERDDGSISPDYSEKGHRISREYSHSKYDERYKDSYRYDSASPYSDPGSIRDDMYDSHSQSGDTYTRDKYGLERSYSHGRNRGDVSRGHSPDVSPSRGGSPLHRYNYHSRTPPTPTQEEPPIYRSRDVSPIEVSITRTVFDDSKSKSVKDERHVDLVNKSETSKDIPRSVIQWGSDPPNRLNTILRDGDICKDARTVIRKRSHEEVKKDELKKLEHTPSVPLAHESLKKFLSAEKEKIEKKFAEKSPVQNLIKNEKTVAMFSSPSSSGSHADSEQGVWNESDLPKLHMEKQFILDKLKQLEDGASTSDTESLHDGDTRLVIAKKTKLNFLPELLKDGNVTSALLSESQSKLLKDHFKPDSTKGFRKQMEARRFMEEKRRDDPTSKLSSKDFDLSKFHGSDEDNQFYDSPQEIPTNFRPNKRRRLELNEKNRSYRVHKDEAFSSEDDSEVKDVKFPHSEKTKVEFKGPLEHEVNTKKEVRKSLEEVTDSHHKHVDKTHYGLHRVSSGSDVNMDSDIRHRKDDKHPIIIPLDNDNFEKPCDPRSINYRDKFHVVLQLPKFAVHSFATLPSSSPRCQPSPRHTYDALKIHASPSMSPAGSSGKLQSPLLSPVGSALRMRKESMSENEDAKVINSYESSEHHGNLNSDDNMKRLLPDKKDCQSDEDSDTNKASAEEISLEERIRLLDEKLMKITPPPAPRPRDTTTLYPGYKIKRRHPSGSSAPIATPVTTVPVITAPVVTTEITEVKAADPSPVAISIMSRPSIFDQDSRRLKQIYQKYEPNNVPVEDSPRKMAFRTKAEAKEMPICTFQAPTIPRYSMTATTVAMDSCQHSTSAVSGIHHGYPQMNNALCQQTNSVPVSCANVTFPPPVCTPSICVKNSQTLSSAAVTTCVTSVLSSAQVTSSSAIKNHCDCVSDYRTDVSKTCDKFSNIENRTLRESDSGNVTEDSNRRISSQSSLDSTYTLDSAFTNRTESLSSVVTTGDPTTPLTPITPVSVNACNKDFSHQLSCSDSATWQDSQESDGKMTDFCEQESDFQNFQVLGKRKVDTDEGELLKCSDTQSFEITTDTICEKEHPSKTDNAMSTTVFKQSKDTSIKEPDTKKPKLEKDSKDSSKKDAKDHKKVEKTSLSSDSGKSSNKKSTSSSSSSSSNKDTTSKKEHRHSSDKKSSQKKSESKKDDAKALSSDISSKEKSHQHSKSSTEQDTNKGKHKEKGSSSDKKSSKKDSDHHHKESDSKKDNETKKDSENKKENDLKKESDVKRETDCKKDLDLKKDTDIKKENDSKKDIDSRKDPDIKKDSDCRKDADMRKDNDSRKEPDSKKELDSKKDFESKKDTDSKKDIESKKHSELKKDPKKEKTSERSDKKDKGKHKDEKLKTEKSKSSKSESSKKTGECKEKGIDEKSSDHKGPSDDKNSGKSNKSHVKHDSKSKSADEKDKRKEDSHSSSKHSKHKSSSKSEPSKTDSETTKEKTDSVKDKNDSAKDKTETNKGSVADTAKEKDDTGKDKEYKKEKGDSNKDKSDTTKKKSEKSKSKSDKNKTESKIVKFDEKGRSESSRDKPKKDKNDKKSKEKGKDKDEKNENKKSNAKAEKKNTRETNIFEEFQYEPYVSMYDKVKRRSTEKDKEREIEDMRKKVIDQLQSSRRNKSKSVYSDIYTDSSDHSTDEESILSTPAKKEKIDHKKKNVIVDSSEDEDPFSPFSSGLDEIPRKKVKKVKKSRSSIFDSLLSDSDNDSDYCPVEKPKTPKKVSDKSRNSSGGHSTDSKEKKAKIDNKHSKTSKQKKDKDEKKLESKSKKVTLDIEKKKPKRKELQKKMTSLIESESDSVIPPKFKSDSSPYTFTDSDSDLDVTLFKSSKIKTGKNKKQIYSDDSSDAKEDDLSIPKVQAEELVKSDSDDLLPVSKNESLELKTESRNYVDKGKCTETQINTKSLPEIDKLETHIPAVEESLTGVVLTEEVRMLDCKSDEHSALVKDMNVKITDKKLKSKKEDKKKSKKSPESSELKSSDFTADLNVEKSKEVKVDVISSKTTLDCTPDKNLKQEQASENEAPVTLEKNILSPAKEENNLVNTSDGIEKPCDTTEFKHHVTDEHDMVNKKKHKPSKKKKHKEKREERDSVDSKKKANKKKKEIVVEEKLADICTENYDDNIQSAFTQEPDSKIFSFDDSSSDADASMTIDLLSPTKTKPNKKSSVLSETVSIRTFTDIESQNISDVIKVDREKSKKSSKKGKKKSKNKKDIVDLKISKLEDSASVGSMSALDTADHGGKASDVKEHTHTHLTDETFSQTKLHEAASPELTKDEIEVLKKDFVRGSMNESERQPLISPKKSKEKTKKKKLPQSEVVLGENISHMYETEENPTVESDNKAGITDLKQPDVLESPKLTKGEIEELKKDFTIVGAKDGLHDDEFNTTKKTKEKAKKKKDRVPSIDALSGVKSPIPDTCLTDICDIKEVNQSTSELLTQSENKENQAASPELTKDEIEELKKGFVVDTTKKNKEKPKKKKDKAGNIFENFAKSSILSGCEFVGSEDKSIELDENSKISWLSDCRFSEKDGIFNSVQSEVLVQDALFDIDSVATEETVIDQADFQKQRKDKTCKKNEKKISSCRTVVPEIETLKTDPVQDDLTEPLHATDKSPEKMCTKSKKSKNKKKEVNEPVKVDSSENHDIVSESVAISEYISKHPEIPDYSNCQIKLDRECSPRSKDTAAKKGKSKVKRKKADNTEEVPEPSTDITAGLYETPDQSAMASLEATDLLDENQQTNVKSNQMESNIVPILSQFGVFSEKDGIEDSVPIVFEETEVSTSEITESPLIDEDPPVLIPQKASNKPKPRQRGRKKKDRGKIVTEEAKDSVDETISEIVQQSESFTQDNTPKEETLDENIAADFTDTPTVEESTEATELNHQEQLRLEREEFEHQEELRQQAELARQEEIRQQQELETLNAVASILGPEPECLAQDEATDLPELTIETAVSTYEEVDTTKTEDVGNNDIDNLLKDTSNEPSLDIDHDQTGLMSPSQTVENQVPFTSPKRDSRRGRSRKNRSSKDRSQPDNLLAGSDENTEQDNKTSDVSDKDFGTDGMFGFSSVESTQLSIDSAISQVNEVRSRRSRTRSCTITELSDINSPESKMDGENTCGKQSEDSLDLNTDFGDESPKDSLSSNETRSRRTVRQPNYNLLNAGIMPRTTSPRQQRSSPRPLRRNSSPKTSPRNQTSPRAQDIVSPVVKLEKITFRKIKMDDDSEHKNRDPENVDFEVVKKSELSDKPVTSVKDQTSVFDFDDDDEDDVKPEPLQMIKRKNTRKKKADILSPPREQESLSSTKDVFNITDEVKLGKSEHFYSIDKNESDVKDNKEKTPTPHRDMADTLIKDKNDVFHREKMDTVFKEQTEPVFKETLLSAEKDLSKFAVTQKSDNVTKEKGEIILEKMPEMEIKRKSGSQLISSSDPPSKEKNEPMLKLKTVSAIKECSEFETILSTTKDGQTNAETTRSLCSELDFTEASQKVVDGNVEDKHNLDNQNKISVETPLATENLNKPEEKVESDLTSELVKQELEKKLEIQPLPSELTENSSSTKAINESQSISNLDKIINAVSVGAEEREREMVGAPLLQSVQQPARKRNSRSKNRNDEQSKEIPLFNKEGNSICSQILDKNRIPPSATSQVINYPVLNSPMPVQSPLQQEKHPLINKEKIDSASVEGKGPALLQEKGQMMLHERTINTLLQEKGMPLQHEIIPCSSSKDMLKDSVQEKLNAVVSDVSNTGPLAEKTIPSGKALSSVGIAVTSQLNRAFSDSLTMSKSRQPQRKPFDRQLSQPTPELNLLTGQPVPAQGHLYSPDGMTQSSGSQSITSENALSHIKNFTAQKLSLQQSTNSVTGKRNSVPTLSSQNSRTNVPPSIVDVSSRGNMASSITDNLNRGTYPVSMEDIKKAMAQNQLEKILPVDPSHSKNADQSVIHRAHTNSVSSQSQKGIPTTMPPPKMSAVQNLTPPGIPAHLINNPSLIHLQSVQLMPHLSPGQQGKPSESSASPVQSHQSRPPSAHGANASTPPGQPQRPLSAHAPSALQGQPQNMVPFQHTSVSEKMIGHPPRPQSAHAPMQAQNVANQIPSQQQQQQQFVSPQGHPPHIKQQPSPNQLRQSPQASAHSNASTSHSSSIKHSGVSSRDEATAALMRERELQQVIGHVSHIPSHLLPNVSGTLQVGMPGSHGHTSANAQRSSQQQQAQHHPSKQGNPAGISAAVHMGVVQGQPQTIPPKEASPVGQMIEKVLNPVNEPGREKGRPNMSSSGRLMSPFMHGDPSNRLEQKGHPPSPLGPSPAHSQSVHVGHPGLHVGQELHGIPHALQALQQQQQKSQSSPQSNPPHQPVSSSQIFPQAASRDTGREPSRSTSGIQLSHQRTSSQPSPTSRSQPLNLKQQPQAVSSHSKNAPNISEPRTTQAHSEARIAQMTALEEARRHGHPQLISGLQQEPGRRNASASAFTRPEGGASNEGSPGVRPTIFNPTDMHIRHPGMPTFPQGPVLPGLPMDPRVLYPGETAQQAYERAVMSRIHQQYQIHHQQAIEQQMIDAGLRPPSQQSQGTLPSPQSAPQTPVSLVQRDKPGLTGQPAHVGSSLPHPPAAEAPSSGEKLLALLQRYPVMWQGMIALKNDSCIMQMHFISGFNQLVTLSMPGLASNGISSPLRISQRMRLEASQLEGVSKRMQMEKDFCILLALPCGRDHNDMIHQQKSLSEGIIKYLKEKQAAGIVNVAVPESQQQPAYVVHIFPPCDFSQDVMARYGRELVYQIHDLPHLLVIITTVV